MKKLVAAVAFGLVALTPAVPAGAGAPAALTVTGDLGPGGTVTISGVECAPQGEWAVIFYKVIDDTTATAIPGVGGGGDANADGTWAHVTQIPADSVPGDEYMFRGSCTWFSSGEPVSFSYEDFVFVMGQPVTPSTPTTEAPPPSEDPAAEPASAQAAAATRPRLTG
jgi:hypothetical protein